MSKTMSSKKRFKWLGVIEANNKIPVSSRKLKSMPFWAYSAYMDGRYSVDVERKNVITFDRTTTPVKVFKNGEPCGNILRTQNKKFSLLIKGKYWKISEDTPNTYGGCTSKTYATLKEAKDAAVKYA